MKSGLGVNNMRSWMVTAKNLNKQQSRYVFGCGVYLKSEKAKRQGLPYSEKQLYDTFVREWYELLQQNKCVIAGFYTGNEKIAEDTLKNNMHFGLYKCIRNIDNKLIALELSEVYTWNDDYMGEAVYKVSDFIRLIYEEELGIRVYTHDPRYYLRDIDISWIYTDTENE